MCRTEQIHSERSVHPITCHEVTEEKWRYSSALSLTLALDEGGWLMLSPSSLPLGMTGSHAITLSPPSISTTHKVVSALWMPISN